MTISENIKKDLNGVITKYKNLELEFYLIKEKESGYQIMKKVEAIVADLGKNFSEYDGGTLSEIQSKLAGYKFFISQYVSDIDGIAKSLKLEVKYIMASRWNDITEDIITKNGKVKNKTEIENVLMEETYDLQQQQILFETFFYQFKMKVSAINELITILTMKISSLKTEMKQQYD